MEALATEGTGSAGVVTTTTWGLNPNVALVAICLLAAGLRFATLGTQSYDFDESYTAGIVLAGSLGHVFHTIPITESTPPLYYVLGWLWSRLSGLGAVGLRSLSALCGLLLVPVSYMIGRRLSGSRAGLCAAGLIAVNPFFVWYSQEARAYALLALLSALSLWTFLRALEQPVPRRLALWALSAAAALVSHYFAGYLVAFEALWLVFATRRRAALLASAAVAAVAAALVPLLVSQADNRSQWIAAISFPSRIKEVVKASLLGPIAPVGNVPLGALALVVIGALVYAVPRLGAGERAGVMVAAAAGVVAVIVPVALDVAGLHYVISKNEMPAVTVLVIVAGTVLGGARSGWIGPAAATVASLFFLAMTIDAAGDPALQRADYRSAVHVLGPPARDQVIVSPRLGDAPIALYRPGAAYVPATGWATRQIVVVRPLRAANVSSTRAPTPAPPPGFTLTGRHDAPSYTLICFAATRVTTVAPTQLLALAGGRGTPSAQVWPAASDTAPRPVCAGAGA